MPTPLIPRVAAAATLSLLAVDLVAQRATPTAKFGDFSTTISHGVVKVGRHSLAALPVGGTWRLGKDHASTWSTDVPLVTDGAVMPPGEYRVSLERVAKDRCVLVANGSGHALGRKEASGDFRLAGKLATLPRPSKKLAIDWDLPKPLPKDATTVNAMLSVQFGTDQWTAQVTLPAGSTQKVGRFRVSTFALEKSMFAAADKPIPVAVVEAGRGRKKTSYNLVLQGNEARLVPWMVAPTTHFGFGEIVPPDAAAITRGTVERQDLGEELPAATLGLRDSAHEKGKPGDLRFTFAVGKELLAVRVPAPGKQ